jgi:hypothetical protein
MSTGLIVLIVAVVAIRGLADGELVDHRERA